MTPWGFRSLSGPFEQLGPERFTALGWALVGVCALDVVARIWPWPLDPAGLNVASRVPRSWAEPIGTMAEVRRLAIASSVRWSLALFGRSY
jgi:hypothetical protein